MSGPSLHHFVRDLPPDQARALFKSSVMRVTVAISSYCNRKCSYCPNSIADRKSHKNFISDDLFFSVMRQLCKIDFSGIIYLHRYNEPLADKDYTLSRIREVRAFLPQAKIHIFTNGDYLDRAYLEDLAVAGVAEIQATVHAGPGGQIDIESLTKEQDRRLSELALPFEFSYEDGVRIATSIHPRGLKLVYNAHDFYRGADQGDAWAYDRGVLPIPRTHVRQKPCLLQFIEMDIEWDGTLLPCCQVNNDAFPHDDYVLGKLKPEDDMFVTWTNANYVKWRLSMSSDQAKGAPCTTCTYGELPEDDVEVMPAIRKLRAVVAKVTAGRAKAAV